VWFSLQLISPDELQPASELLHGSSLMLNGIDSRSGPFPPFFSILKKALEQSICRHSVPRHERQIMPSRALQASSGSETERLFPIYRLPGSLLGAE
jgi:hypothetical protein